MYFEGRKKACRLSETRPAWYLRFVGYKLPLYREIEIRNADSYPDIAKFSLYPNLVQHIRKGIASTVWSLRGNIAKNCFIKKKVHRQCRWTILFCVSSVEARFDDLLGASLHASHAARALRIIDDRQIVLHRDGGRRAFLGAQPAADAADIARCHDFLAPAMGGTRHIDGRGGGDAADDVLGAGQDARAAAEALVRIDLSNAVLDMNAALRAHRRAVSAAEAAFLTQFVAAEKGGCLRTGRSADGAEGADGGSARAMHDGNGTLLRFELDAEELGDLRLPFGGSHMAS